jgi:hypothetical protein
MPCTGDCNRTGAVTLDEEISLVTMALEGASAAPCTAADPDDNDRITIEEIVAAVGKMIEGCAPAPLP